MNNLSNENNTNQNTSEGNAKKGSKTAVKIIVITVIVLSVLGVFVIGFFMFKIFKVVSTPREALSISEFMEAAEELGYESSGSDEEDYGDYCRYADDKGRTMLVFREFDSKRDAQDFYEELLEDFNKDSAFSNMQINGTNYLIEEWSKTGVYYYAELVDSTVVFVTTEDKEELNEITNAFRQ